MIISISSAWEHQRQVASAVVTSPARRLAAIPCSALQWSICAGAEVQVCAAAGIASQHLRLTIVVPTPRLQPGTEGRCKVEGELRLQRELVANNKNNCTDNTLY